MKRRLCLRGDQEIETDSIAKDSRTINKINIKLLLTEAIRKDWDFQSSDVTLAFLQTPEIDKELYVNPPMVAVLPGNKIWKLKRSA